MNRRRAHGGEDDYGKNKKIKICTLNLTYITSL